MDPEITLHTHGFVTRQNNVTFTVLHRECANAEFNDSLIAHKNSYPVIEADLLKCNSLKDIVQWMFKHRCRKRQLQATLKVHASF